MPIIKRSHINMLRKRIANAHRAASLHLPGKDKGVDHTPCIIYSDDFQDFDSSRGLIYLNYRSLRPVYVYAG